MLAQVIKRYDNAYYFDYIDEKATVDPAHDDWMRLFISLSFKEFLQIKFDYCFFEKNLSNRKSMEVISNLHYSRINSIMMIEDNNLITHQSHNAKEFYEFWNKVGILSYSEL